MQVVGFSESMVISFSTHELESELRLQEKLLDELDKKDSWQYMDEIEDIKNNIYLITSEMERRND